MYTADELDFVFLDQTLFATRLVVVLLF